MSGGLFYLQYRPEINGLRALAVVPVILFHAGFAQFGGGFVGVDVFFVISGYLITGIILSDMDQGSFSLINFYERRARRILPALFLVMGFTAIVAWFWLVPRDMEKFAQSVIAVSTFSSNILFSGEQGYFDSPVELRPLLHTWSLAVEEQYYIIFPAFLMLIWSLGNARILAMIVLISIGSFALIYSDVFRSNAVFYLLPTRAWEILTGAVAAFFFNRYREKKISKGVNELVSFSGLIFITYAVFAFDDKTPFPSVQALVPVIGTLLVIMCAQSGTLTAQILGHRILVGIGLISYSAYLWHQPIFAFLKYRSVEQPSALLIGALIVMSFGLAYFSWRFVEEPFRKKDVFSSKSILWFGLTGTMVFIVFGFVGTATGGFADRFSGYQKKALETAQASPLRQKCHDRTDDFRKPADACVYHHDNPTWAVFGDSHTVELAYAMADLLRPEDEGVRHYSFSDCSPSFGNGNGSDCTKWTHDAITYIIKDPTMKNVVVSYRMTTALHGDHEGHYPALPEDLPNAVQEAVWEAYIAVLQELVSGGKQVYLVLQAPELPIAIQRVIRFSPVKRGISGTGITIPGVPQDWWDRRTKYITDRIDQLPEEVNIIDPADMLCSEGQCRAVIDGKAMYFDDDHMSVVGAKIVAERILARQASK